MPNNNIGFDGEDVWLKNKNTTAYKLLWGIQSFYYNLMFYFYVMPFILANDGVLCVDSDPLVFEDVT